jgi:m7GpppX diphosphatase
LIQNEKYTILPDFKFADLTDISSLHLLVIFADKELCSIRDLRENHIDLLEEVRRVVDDLLTTKFGMEKNSYRLYFHYPPTFYRLHIHVVSLKLASMGAIVDRAHLLSTIIANLKIFPLYYKNMPIPIIME